MTPRGIGPLSDQASYPAPILKRQFAV